MQTAAVPLLQGDTDEQSLLQGPPENELFILCKEKKKSLNVTHQGQTGVERAAVGQTETEEWHKQRHNRITSSHFGRIIKLRPTTSPTNLLKTLLGFTHAPKNAPAIV